MKNAILSLVLFLLVIPGIMNADDIPDLSRRPYEIITGELPKPQEGLLWNAEENGISSWIVSGPGSLATDGEFCLWNETSARMEFTGTERVTLEPAPAISIQEPVRGVTFWIICPTSGKTTNLLQIRDAQGKNYTLKTLNNSSFWSYMPWWGTSTFAIPSRVVFPITITGLVFEPGKKTKPGDALHFDFLQTYKINPVDYPQDIVESAGDYLTTPDGMLPTPPKEKYSNSLTHDGYQYIFCYDGENGLLQYLYSPATGTLGDVSASFDCKMPFLPMAGGGIHARKNGILFTPDDPEITSTLLEEKMDGDLLTTRWRWEKKGVSIDFTYTFTIKGRTLVITADCYTPDVEEFNCGCVKGLPDPRLFHLTYLNYRWNYPRLLVNDDIFVSLFADWYSSNAYAYAVTAKILGEDSASILKGTSYRPKIRGEKNLLHERLFLTVSPALEDVLPNIPNPRSEYFDEMKTLICHTRMYPVTAPKHVPTELAYEELLVDYGVKDIFIRTHYNEFRTPSQNNSFTFSLHANLKIGDELCREFYEKLRKIFPRVGPYQDHRVIHPLRAHYFNHDYLSQWYSDELFVDGWDGAYQLNPVAQRMLFREFTPGFTARYPWNACYLDEATNTPPWGMVDFNGYTPGAGTFRSTLLHIGNLLREVRNYYNGPVWSEGNSELFWAGCLDTSYAQTNEPDELPLPDFKLRKINPLENLNGYDLTKKSAELNYLLSAQIVFGNIGHIWGGPECDSILGAFNTQKYTPTAFRNIIKSYYMMRQLQELYAGVPVEIIQYQCGDEMLTATEMLRGKRQNEGKVFTRYENGLEVWVNRNPEATWTVNANETEYTLPPFGYVAVLPGVFLEYSAEINGHLADFVSGPQYVYADGHGMLTHFPGISAANAYVMIPEENATRLIPVPFLEEESIEIPNARKATPLDAKRNPIGETIELDGKGRLGIALPAFQWRLE